VVQVASAQLDVLDGLRVSFPGVEGRGGIQSLAMPVHSDRQPGLKCLDVELFDRLPLLGLNWKEWLT